MHVEILFCLGQSQWGFIRVSWALNMLVRHRIDEERDDKSFMRVERVSWDKTLLHYFQNMDALVTGS